MTISGHFTIQTGDTRKGRAHLVEVVCDLCKGMKSFDAKTHILDDNVEAIMDKHRCEKPKPEKPNPKKRQLRPVAREYEAGSLRHILGPPEDERD